MSELFIFVCLMIAAGVSIRIGWALGDAWVNWVKRNWP